MPGAPHQHDAGEEHVSVAMVVNAVAVAVFAVLMSAFWWFVGSRELQAQVERKAELLAIARRHLPEGPVAWGLDYEVETAMRRDADRAQRLAAARTLYNRRLLWRFLGPFLGVTVGALLGLLAHNAWREPRRGLQWAHWMGILFVFVAYIPEVLFFLVVINRHTAIGDVELMRRLTAGGCAFLPTGG